MSLVQRLPDGPLDIIGDVHGELEALRTLLQVLGYDPRGRHAEGRRLVFVGDLVDRGPDSPGVMRLVAEMLACGLAHGVLGNHEMNLGRELRKQGNAWFYGEAEVMGPVPCHVPQRPAEERDRQLFRDLFSQLPLALERDDLRVVHACWDEGAIARARRAECPLDFYQSELAAVESRLAEQPEVDPQVKRLAKQNENAVKLLTAGREASAATPFEAGDKLRAECRVPWWREYRGPMCVVGHYWRFKLPGDRDEELFAGLRPGDILPGGAAMCIDYSIGRRFVERQRRVPETQYITRLAALRWPEREVVTERGEKWPLT